MGSSKSHGCWILLVAVLALTSCSLPRTEGAPAQPARATDAPKVQLGKLAFIRDGNLWAKDLPDGTAVQLTKDGGSREPRWSASGQWLSFSKSSPSGLEAWIARADGTEAHRLEPSSVSKGIWSPVRDEVAYGLKGGLYLVNADGSGRREVVPPSGKESVGATRLAWSPDGQWIAFEKTDASRAGPPLYQGLSYQGLWVVGADGSGAREVYANANPQDYQSYLAGWTPDGQSLLYWQGRHMSASMMADGLPLMEVPVSGGTPTQVSGTRMLAHPELLDWSRDGKLALIDGGFRESWEGKQIAVAEPGRLRMLSDKGRSDLFPAWSPDGSLIAFTGGPAAPGTPGGDDAKRAMAQRHLWLMQPDGSGKLQITSDPKYRDERPQWPRDGAFILFGRFLQSEQMQLWLMRSDGSDQKQVVDGLGSPPRPGEPAWFGYYGYVDWSSMYDWWRGGPISPPASTPSPAAGTPPPTQAVKTPPDAIATPPTALGPRDTLDRFMAARVRRQDTSVMGLLSDGLRKALETGQLDANRVDLFQVSDPCWYRYEVLSFRQPIAATAEVRVRVYQHFWGGDIVAGPPRSWEQELSLVEMPTGWRVDRVSEPRNNREEDNEPHGLTASACSKGTAAPTPSATITSRPSIGQFRLASHRRIDDKADPEGGTPVYIVDRDIEVRARVSGIQRLDVHLALSARETFARAAGVPDANGDVAVPMHLPEAGVIYVLSGSGVLSDQRPERSGDLVNDRNELILPPSGFRVMAEQE